MLVPHFQTKIKILFAYLVQLHQIACSHLNAMPQEKTYIHSWNLDYSRYAIHVISLP